MKRSCKQFLKRCEELGFTPDPTTVHLDFEQAAINAVKATFGPHVLTLGCFYHLTHATWRKVQELGLSQYYKENGSFRHFCGMLDGEDQPTIRLRKMPPLFPPQMWNVHNATLRGESPYK